VPHAHLHLIPITSERDIDFRLADPNAPGASLDEAARLIRGALIATGHGEQVGS